MSLPPNSAGLSLTALITVASMACGATDSSEPKALDLFVPAALDLDQATVTDSVGVGHGSEVQIYLRSGAPWFSSTPGIQVAYRDRPPSVRSCTAANDWTFFEAPVSALRAQSYFCIVTSEGRVGWFRVDHVAGLDQAVTVHFATGG